MKHLLLATRNHHKTQEFAEILGTEFEVIDLRSVSGVPEIAETGNSFEENARIKALTVSTMFPEQWVIADDSGLEVNALGGAPGVYSARFAGTGATETENVKKLLTDLQKVHDRSARFVCAIAVAHHAALVSAMTGEIAGKIAQGPSGNLGFGYDPIFIPMGEERTFAELAGPIKNQISHRAKAIARLRDILKHADGGA